MSPIPPLPEVDTPFHVSRLFQATPECLFAMWSDPRHLSRWWQPGGFHECRIDVMEFRPDGRLEIYMPALDGTLYESKSVYGVIEPPSLLTYHERCYENGKLFHDAQMTVRFEAVGSGTRMTIEGVMNWVPDRSPRWTPDAVRQGWTIGWEQNMDHLENVLRQDNP